MARRSPQRTFEVCQHTPDGVGTEGIEEIEDKIAFRKFVLGGIGEYGFDVLAPLLAGPELREILHGLLMKRCRELDADDARKWQLGCDEEHAALAGTEVNEGIKGRVPDAKRAECSAGVRDASRRVDFAVSRLTDGVAGFVKGNVAGGAHTPGCVKPPIFDGAYGGADRTGCCKHGFSVQQV